MVYRLIHTTDGIVTVCDKCGEEIMSILHICNPFRDIKLEEERK